MLSSEQIRGARAMIRLEQKELADAAGVSTPTTRRLEKGSGLVRANVATVDAICRALEIAGVEFPDDRSSDTYTNYGTGRFCIRGYCN